MLIKEAPCLKQAVQIRLDTDVLAWLKGYGKGYQSRIDTVFGKLFYGVNKNERRIV